MGLPYGDSQLNYSEYIRKPGHHTDASRGAPFNYLAMMKAGNSRFVGEGYDLEFSPGELYFIPFGFRYHSYWYGAEEVIWDSIAFRWFPGGSGYYPQRLDGGNGRLESFQSFTKKFRRVDCAAISKFYAMMELFLPAMEKRSKPHLGKAAQSALDLMVRDPEITVSEAAKRSGISESGLFCEFRKIGTTPVKARLDAQINYARELLISTDMTVDEISEKCGFSSSAYFYRVFRKVTGKTTREIRAERMM